MDPIAILPGRFKRIAREYIERRGFTRVFDRAKVDKVWIDVGAHLGQGTLDAARENPGLLVFAFEPNWTLARQIMARAVNYVVLPMAVSDNDGFAEFFVNASDQSSSLVTMEAPGIAHWKDLDLTVQSKVVVPTIRLDTFMKLSDLRTVDYLKVDAEGVDLRVVRSAGDRLRDIRQVKLEVDIAPDRLYSGAPSREEVITFMLNRGLKLIEAEIQSDGRQENLTFARASSGPEFPPK
jgi:FkbM family methyltransferase